MEEVKTTWGDTRVGITYICVSTMTKTWIRQQTYGGSLAENVTQAVARDLLADAIIRLQDKGYPTIMHVHDEIVSEVPEGFGSVHEMENIMSTPPEWALDLPLGAEGFRTKRYRK